jgi:hypothetical protein
MKIQDLRIAFRRIGAHLQKLKKLAQGSWFAGKLRAIDEECCHRSFEYSPEQCHKSELKVFYQV